jgi:hypothetical protein
VVAGEWPPAAMKRLAAGVSRKREHRARERNRRGGERRKKGRVPV